MPDESHVWLITEHGTFREWSDLDTTTGVYQTVAPSNEYRTLTWTGSGWTLEELDGTVHAFNGGGLWTSTTYRNANGGLNAKVATYVGNVLDHVTFPDDTREDFAYYPAGDPSEGKLKSITVVGVDLSTTRTWTYHWTGDDLTRIDRPDDTKIHYLYGDIAHPGYLTRITLEGTDGTSTRIERAYEYDARGNVVATWRGDADKTGPDAVDLWKLSFDDPTNPTVTTVTDPLDQEITYHLEHEADSASIKVTSIDGDCPVCSLGPNVELRLRGSGQPRAPAAAEVHHRRPGGRHALRLHATTARSQNAPKRTARSRCARPPGPTTRTIRDSSPRWKSNPPSATPQSARPSGSGTAPEIRRRDGSLESRPRAHSATTP